MLTGTAPLEAFAADAATMPGFATETAGLGDVELLKVFLEVAVTGRTSTLPPGLHPSNPPTAVLHVWRVGSSPWGPFSMAEARVGCRSGTRPRGLVLGCVVDGPDPAVADLRARWGFPARPGQVVLRRTYDGVRAEVALGGGPVCVVEAFDPVPVDPADLAWTTTLTLAGTPRGTRLVQVEVDHRPVRSERLRARVPVFDATAWAHPDLVPTVVVSASVSVGAATLPRLRFVARPDELAFTGTEPTATDDTEPTATDDTEPTATDDTEPTATDHTEPTAQG
jgi:hypothetical protein